MSVPRASVVLALCVLCAGIAHGAEPPVVALALPPDARTLVTGSQSGIVEWSWPGLERLRAVDTKLVHVHDLAFSPDGRQLLAVGGRPAEESAFELWDWPDGRLVLTISTDGDTATGADWSPAGNVFAMSGRDGTVRVVDRATGAVRQRLEGHSRGVTATRFLGAERLVSAGDDATLRLWDLETVSVIRTLDNHTGPVHALALRPDATGAALPVLASAGDDRTVRLWQPTIGRMVKFVRPESIPLCLQWLPDGSAFVVGCTDGGVRMYDANTLQPLLDRQVLEGWCYALAIEPEGRWAAVGGSDGAVVRIPLSSAVRDGR